MPWPDEPFARQIREQLTPWSVGTLAQAAGVAVLAEADYARQTVACVGQQRRQLTERLQAAARAARLSRRGEFPPGAVGRAGHSTAPLRLAESDCSAAGIAIRTFDAAQHLDERFFRVAVRTAAENQRLCDALGDALTELGATAGLPSSARSTGGRAGHRTRLIASPGRRPP